MKKVIFASYIFLVAFLCIGICANAEETNYDENWVSWSQHHWSTYDSPVVGWGIYGSGANEKDPWYYNGLDDNSKGIVIRHEDTTQSGTRYRFFYLSTTNTAQVFEENRAANRVYPGTMTLWTNNSTIVDGDFENLFHLSGKIYVWGTGYHNATEIRDMNYDISCTSSQELYNQLQALDWQNPSGITGEGQLPLLSYTLERKLVPQLSLNVMTIKEILKWNFEEKEPYKSDPSHYTFEIWASANWTNAPDGIGRIWDANNYTVNPENKVVVSDGGNNISINEFSFTYDDVGKSVYNRSNKDWRNDSINAPTLGYFIYIRTKSNDGSKVSVWKIFKVQAGGYVSSIPTVMNPDGTYSDADNIQDGNDGLDPSNNGTTPYDPDNSTTAGSDPSSELYDGEGAFNISTMINSLKSMINSLKDIPNILTQLLTFLPDWLTTLIILSIGMFVVVGTVRLLLKG